jgi:hypothetical protein
MAYIIVWRPNSRDPFIQTDSHYFKEEFSTYDEAKQAADENLDNDHFRYYSIFEEVTS